MKKNNKGSAFVTVLVILAIVGILAAVALWASLVNYQMKITDIKVKNNFYSAEGALDQICVGLQKDVSDAYQKAYKKMVVNYASMSEAQRKEFFEKQYKLELKEILKTRTGVDKTYELTRLQNYVDKDWRDPARLPYAEIKSIRDDRTESTSVGDMVMYKDHIVLRRIDVTFTDAEGYMTEIQTDISISIPKSDYIDNKSMPKPFGYSLLATAGIKVENGSVIAGNVYAGSENGLDIQGGVTFEDFEYLISKGMTKITEGSTQTAKLAGTNGQLWTQGIVVDGEGKVEFEGEVYVKDDLTLKGAGPKVTLGEKYVGFGCDKLLEYDPTDPVVNSMKESDKNSAIIINGKNSSLDMTNVKELRLGGYAYVSTSAFRAEDGATPANDVLMGESIAIKGDQFMYLVPAECIGIENGASKYNSNPLTREQYMELIVDPTKYTLLSGEYGKDTLGKNLKEYLEDGEGIEDITTKVFQSNGLVYFYMNFPDGNRASNYAVDFKKNADTGKLQLYTNHYADQVRITADPEDEMKEGGEDYISTKNINIAGNYTLVNENGISWKKKTGNDVAELNLCNNQFKGACHVLKPEFTDITLEPYDYLINDSNFQTIVPTGTAAVSEESVDGKVAVLVNNTIHTFHFPTDLDRADVPGIDASEAGKVALIVCTGNVEINADFTGSVFTKGNINVHGKKVDSMNGELMKKVLDAKIGGNHLVYNIFNEGVDYRENLDEVPADGGAPADGNSAAQKNNYSGIITYQNWNQK